MEESETETLSTAEAEYIAISSAAQESVWLRQLIAELTRFLTHRSTDFDL